MEESDAESAGHPLAQHYHELLSRSEVHWRANRQLQRCLGVGGQGRVYLSHRLGAEHFSLPVALKVFDPSPFETEQAYHEEMTRVVGVSAQVARIQHDNVVDIQDFIDIDGIIVMEMEWVDGFDLRCLLTPTILHQLRSHASKSEWQKLNREVITEERGQPRLKPSMAIAIIRECLQGLSSLHAAEIVHNDLKPSNIMLKRSGNVKLIDTGSAFSISNKPEKVTCTPELAAPEVLSGSLATIQSDIASLGYVLLEMLSGQRPFRDMNVKTMLDAKRNIFQALPTFLPREEFVYFDLLLPLLRRMLAPNPDDRFESALQADQGDGGAAAFEEELVKGDLPLSYEADIRQWIKDVDSGFDDNDHLASTRTFPN